MLKSAEWKQGKFSDVAEIIMGQSPAGHTYNQQGIGMPLLNGPTEFTQRYPKKIQWTTQPTKQCKQGDILLCVRGSSTGRINIANLDYCIGRGIAAIRAKKDKGLTDYLEQQLIYGLQKILALTSGSTFPNIDRKSIGEISVVIPELQEQKRIVSILATWDEAIAKTEKLITAKQKLKEAFYQKIIPNNPKIKSLGWSWYKLKDIATINNSGLSENTAASMAFYYVDLTSVKQGEIEFPQEKIRFWESPSRARRLAKLGDVIMSTVRPNLRGFAYLDLPGDDLVFSTGFAILQAKPGIDARYLYHCLYSSGVEGQIQARVTGSNYPALSVGDLNTMLFPFPDDKSKQFAIANFLFALDSEIKLLNQTLFKLRTQKRGLMQKLLTGKWRVTVEKAD